MIRKNNTTYRLVLTFFLGALFLSNVIQAQSFQSLEGEEIEPIECEVLGIMCPKSPIPFSGRLDKALIRTDKKSELSIAFYYSGLTSGYLFIEVFDQYQNSLERVIKGKRIDLRNAPNPVTIKLKIEGNGESVVSNLLKATLVDEYNIGKKIVYFNFPKSWETRYKEVRTIPVSVEPIGLAKNLQSQNIAIPDNDLKIGGVDEIEASFLALMDSALADTSIQDSALNQFKPAGPSNYHINILTEVRTEYQFPNSFALSSIQLGNIYMDQNPLSGAFYYLPVSYFLDWHYKDGYSFNMCYRNMDGVEEGKVSIYAKLKNHITSDEENLVRDLVKSYCANRKDLSFKSLNAIIPNNPSFTVTSLTQIHAINPDEISASISSSIYEPFKISWNANNNVKNEIESALRAGVAVEGDVIFDPPSELEKQRIPFYLDPSSSGNFGRIILSKTSLKKQLVTNYTPYPMSMKKLHVLMIIEKDGKTIPCVYTWSLNNTVIPQKSKAKFMADKIPDWLYKDDRVRRIWVEYEIEKCSDCTGEVLEQIVCPTSKLNQRIKFNSLGVVEQYSAEMVLVKIQSLQLDPSNEQLNGATIKINSDNEDFESPIFHIKNGESLNYEYTLEIVTKDTTYTGNTWKVSNQDWVPINQSVLKDCGIITE